MAAGLALAWQSAMAAGPVRRAVVVGNAAYAGMPPLPGCETSARLAASGLKRAGFEVTQLSNPANARIGAAFAGLADGAGTDARLVVYVCGYVSFLGGRLFLLPVNASVAQDSEALSQGVVARVPFSAVSGTGVGAGLLLVDGQARPGGQVEIVAGLARAGDSTRAGYALAIGTPDATVPGLLPASLAEALDGGEVEVGAFLAALPGKRRGREAVALSTGMPGEAAWLSGGPATAVQPIPAPVAAPGAAPVPLPIAVPLAPIDPAAPVVADDATAELSPADRRSAQLELQRLGYYRGRVDGQFGAETVVAIRQFQRELGAAGSGTLSNGQAGRLLRR